MKDSSPITIHYTLGCVLIGLYGTQVCPFIDSLPFTSLALPITGYRTGIYARKLKISLKQISSSS